jgi:hypothetical protein
MLKSLVGRLREVQDRLDTWIGGSGDRLDAHAVR